MTAVLTLVAIVSVLTLLTWLCYVVGSRCSDWLHAHYGEEPLPDAKPHLTIVKEWTEPFDWEKQGA